MRIAARWAVKFHPDGALKNISWHASVQENRQLHAPLVSMPIASAGYRFISLFTVIPAYLQRRGNIYFTASAFYGIHALAVHG